MRPFSAAHGAGLWLTGGEHRWPKKVHDWGVIAAPWGFLPQEITIEVDLWQGDQDDRVPSHHAQYLASAIPRSHLTVLRGEGHMIAFTCIE